ncbi:MAG: S8 family serine peptidase [Bacteroidales bacterium]|nr:S8 family serine peptidase [Bacteroidales bacterium]
MKKIKIYAALMFLVFSGFTVYSQEQKQGTEKIKQELLRQIQSSKPDVKISCIVEMKATYPYESVKSRSVQNKIETFRNIAKTSQESVLTWLRSLPIEKAEVKQLYWVMNGFHLLATADIIKTLSERDDIKVIYEDAIIVADGEILKNDATKTVPSRAVEWNVLKIGADKCWDAGYTGQNVIIGILDTGVDYTHPALSSQYSGYWHVAAGLPQQATPYDDHGHGTHCAGSILGGDGRGPFAYDIGIAPNAKYVAVKILDSQMAGSGSDINEGLQYIVDLKATVDIKAISNSWCSKPPNDNWFTICNTFKSLGIIAIFANGNWGPGPSTEASPADYPHTIGVGMVDINDDINDMSSRGPAPNTSPWNDQSYWFTPDWNYIKPNISAPGVNINSAKPGGTYQTMGGTSMATPQVCGAAALLYSKNPTLTTKQVYDLLINNVDLPPQGAPYPNNNYGWGRLNVWKALQHTPTANMPWVYILSKTVDAVTAGQTGNATVNVKNVGGSNANNTTVKLISNDNFVKINDGIRNFGLLTVNQTADNVSNPFTFTAHSLTPAGHVANMMLVTHADGSPANYDDTIRFTITIGTAPNPVPVFSDDFEYVGGADSFPQYWTATGNWSRITSKSHSATHSAYSGASKDGDAILTLKNAVDLSKYPQVFIKFWNSYDFITEQMVTVGFEKSTNGGSNWEPLWDPGLTSTNLQAPWAEVTKTVSQPGNSFKVRCKINIGNSLFVTKADLWIDDFSINIPKDNEPPYFTNTTVWHDTLYTGPFLVKSDITDASTLNNTYLYYRVNGASWNQLALPKQSGNTYQATIPSQSLNDSIEYYLWADDKWTPANAGTDPVSAIQSTEYFKFKITNATSVNNGKLVDDFIIYPIPSNSYVEVYANVLRKSKLEISVFDIAGRKIETVIENNVNPGYYQYRWNEDGKVKSGVYFINIKCSDNNTTFNSIKKVVIL